MVNTEKFGERLNRILEFYDLTAASFADKIDVGRSSISHILSGRNKPSLDFVMKVVQNFPEVELYWLLNGKGTFPPSKSFLGDIDQPKVNDVVENQPRMQPVNTTNFNEDAGNPNPLKKIKRIVFFYEDGSFEAFQN